MLRDRPNLRPPREILHLNVANFAVAVRRIVDPVLKERPVLIALPGSARAVVYDMSEEAYRVGVHKGMAVGSALRRVPGAAVCGPDFDLHERAMRALIGRTLGASPQIERATGDGHLYLDLSGTGRLCGPARDVAWRLRKAISRELGLDPIWTVAPNKLLAKAASRSVKPDGERIVASGEEEAFLRTFPLGLLPGVSPNARIRLREFNLLHVGEAARLEIAQLETALGSGGGEAGAVYRAVRGIDDSPVSLWGEGAPEVRQDHAFAEDTNDEATVRYALGRMVERACYRLRADRLATGRVTIFLEYSDGARATRCAVLPTPTANDFNLKNAALGGLEKGWCRRIRLRRIRLVCDRLGPPQMQLALFDAERTGEARRSRMLETMDQIRDRFGIEAIGFSGGTQD